MRANDIVEILTGFQREVRGINENAISNDLMNTEKKKIVDLFKKFDGKTNSIKQAVQKTQGMAGGDYTYPEPKGVSVNSNITADQLKSELTFHAERLSKFRDNLKAGKYKVVNANTNKISNLNNPTKSLFTKAIKELKELSELF